MDTGGRWLRPGLSTPDCPSQRKSSPAGRLDARSAAFSSCCACRRPFRTTPGAAAARGLRFQGGNGLRSTHGTASRALDRTSSFGRSRTNGAGRARETALAHRLSSVLERGRAVSDPLPQQRLHHARPLARSAVASKTIRLLSPTRTQLRGRRRPLRSCHDDGRPGRRISAAVFGRPLVVIVSNTDGRRLAYRHRVNSDEGQESDQVQPSR